MKKAYLFFCLLVYVILQPSYEAHPKGHICSHRRGSKVFRTGYRQKGTLVGYTSSCGILNLGRCRKKRVRYIREKYTWEDSKYRLEVTCCPGWERNKNDEMRCTKHSKLPRVVSCPSPQKYRRRNSKDVISWRAPTFKDQHGYPLKVTSDYPKNKAVLKWGANHILYKAESDFTSMNTECQITVNVLPIAPEPVIAGRRRGEKITVAERVPILLTCTARYSQSLKKELEWFVNGRKITDDIVFQTMEADFTGYHHSSCTLFLTLTRADNDVRVECRMGKSGKKYQVFLSVTYEVPPVVSFCPADQLVESPNQKSPVVWQPAVFRDTRYGDPVEVTTNYGKDVTEKDFKYGKYDVVYTGTNTRNHLKVTCKFRVTVKPMVCSLGSLLPANGAVVCGYWGQSFIRACYRVCRDHNGKMWAGTYSKLSICQADGQWSSIGDPIVCADEIKTNTCIGNARCYAGKCDTPGITEQHKRDFIQKMMNTKYNSICGRIDENMPVHMTLQCEDFI